MNPIFIFDSSALISLSEKCFFHLLQKIQSHSNCRFIISPSVWNETVTVPQNIKRFELNAERIKQGVEDGWLEIVHPTSQTTEWNTKINQWSNNAFLANTQPLTILQAGEIETMALYQSLHAQGMVIDERTARMIIEEPIRLHNYLRLKHDKTITKNNNALQALQKSFQDCLIVRSVDLLGWAYRHDLFKYELPNTTESLEAALYAVKYAGCAVSGNEIDDFVAKNKTKKA